MCSWGQAAKNSTTCSHEWRTHRTSTLIFNIETWRRLERSIPCHGHKCQDGVESITNMEAGWTARRTRGPALIWTNLLDHRPLNTCIEISHENSQVCVMTCCLLFVAQQSPSLKPLPPCREGLPRLSRVTAPSLWHKSSIWFHLTGVMNNLKEGIIISSPLH